MGGSRSFFLESKFFQLVVEEGGQFFLLRIFERSRYFMKSVFMGKNGAQWLMKSIEQIVVGISPKNFYTFREGDLAYTLQWISNSFGMFLLLTKFKVGGSRRSIFIPEGRAKNGWRVFGLELRKLLEPEKYVNGGSGFLKFVAQHHKVNSGVQPFKTFADMVRGPQVQVKGWYQPKLVSAHVKRKMLLEDNNKEKQNLVFEQRLVSTSGPTTLGGGEVGSRCINEEFEFGETDTVKKKRRSLLKIHSNWNKHAYGKERELRQPDWTKGGLSIEVNEEGIKRVAWSSDKDGLRYPIWVNRSQREQVVGPSRSRVYHKRRGFKSLKWVTQGEKPIVGLGSNCDIRGPEKLVLDLGPKGNTCMGFPNIPELTNPIRLEVVESSSLADPRPNTHKARDSAMVVSSKTQHDGFAAQNERSTEPTMEVGSTEPPTPNETGLAKPVVMSRSDDDERSLSVNQVHVVSPVGAAQTEAEGVLSTHRHWVSLVEVSGCTESLLKMGFRFSSNRNSILGFNMLSGGLISEDKRLVILEFVPRLVGPSCPNLFLEFLRAGSKGFEVLGQEVNSFSSNF
nr:uncharacterized protein LOC112007156 [Quercus suber]